MKKLITDDQGQAVIEYILSLALAVFMVGLIATGFRSALIKLWESIGQEVSAACPKCPPDPTVRIGR